jgi:hypothetical protein
VGALVQLTGGPRATLARLGEVAEAESPTMRLVRVGRDGAGADYVRVGVRGLRLYAGKDSGQ